MSSTIDIDPPTRVPLHLASSPLPSDTCSQPRSSRDSTPSSADISEPASTMPSGSEPSSSQPTQLHRMDSLPEHGRMGGVEVVTGNPHVPEDVDGFIKRMEMEQKMSALQSRLELASIKTSHAWTSNGAVNGSGLGAGDHTDGPPRSPITVSAPATGSATSFAERRPSSSKLPPIRVEPYPTSPAQRDAAMMPPPATSPIAPSRAPGGQARYEPPSPSRPWQLMDVLWQPLPPPSAGPSQPQAHMLSPRKRTRDDAARGHRRASSGNSMSSMMQAPSRAHAQIRMKDRSYSHSTTADVNAAKALAFMHRPTSSLPIPASPRNGSRERRAITPDRQDKRAPRSHSVKARRPSRPEEAEEDRSAAELMMFLAHSPSPLRKPDESPRPTPSTARVLFGGGGEERKSNLAVAPPITNSDFGGYL